MIESAETDLPDPDSPTTQTVSPRRDVEPDLLDDEIAGAGPDGQLLDPEDGTAHVRPAILGSSTSRATSPRTLMLSTVNDRNAPA